MNKIFQKIYNSMFFSDKYYLVGFFLDILLNIGIWTYILLSLSTLHKVGEDYIYLHYNVYYGRDYYDLWYYIFILPAVGLVFFIINFILSRFSNKYSKALTYTLVYSCFIMQVVIAWVVYLIIQDNSF